MFGSVHTYLVLQFWVSLILIISKTVGLIFKAASVEKRLGLVIYLLLGTYMLLWEARLLDWI